MVFHMISMAHRAVVANFCGGSFGLGTVAFSARIDRRQQNVGSGGTFGDFVAFVTSNGPVRLMVETAVVEPAFGDHRPRLRTGPGSGKRRIHHRHMRFSIALFDIMAMNTHAFRCGAEHRAIDPWHCRFKATLLIGS